MWASRRSITSAAIPDVRRFALAASLLFLPTFLTAGPRAAPQPAQPPSSDETYDPEIDESATEADLRPIETLHFYVLTTKKGVERTGLMETARTSFLHVTNVAEERVPAKIRVVIYPNHATFVRVTKKRGERAIVSPDEIATYEQKNMNSLLVREMNNFLFNSVLKWDRRKELVWLKSGISDAVAAHVARIGPRERKEQLMADLKETAPIKLGQLLGEKPSGNEKRYWNPKKEGQKFDLTSASLTNYLLQIDSGLGITFLMNNLADGQKLDVALSGAYPGKVRGMQELYDRWKRDVVSLVRKDK